MPHLLSAIIGLPALGALILVGVPSLRAGVTRGLAMACASLALILSLVVWVEFQPRGVQWQFLEQAQWFSAMGVSYVVALDGFGALVVVLTTMATWSAVLLTEQTADRARASYAATLALETGVVGAIASLNLLCFALFWVAATVSAWRLMRAWSDGDARSAASRFTRYVSLGTCAVLAGIAMLVVNGHAITGVYTFDLRVFQGVTLPPLSQGLVLAAFLVGFGIVGGAFPLHLAHRDAIAETPPAVWIPIAIVLSNLGTFGLLRLTWPIVPDAVRVAAPGIAVVSLVGAVVAVVLAMRQPTWPRFLAYGSVAHVSILLFSATLLTPSGVTGTMVQHITHSAVMLALTLTVITPHAQVARWGVVTLLAIVTGLAISPAPIPDRIETSVARIILRVSPQHAAEVADCLSASHAPPPPPEIPGLPASASMAAPCDTSEVKK